MRFYLFVAFLILLACSGDYYQSYFERAACIKLPAGLSNVAHFTESDIAFTSHYTIPEDSIDGLSQELNLQPEPPEDWMPILFVEELPKSLHDIPEDGIILYCTGSNNWNSWDILLHLESCGMWVTVYYTDAGGDPPPRSNR